MPVDDLISVSSAQGSAAEAPRNDTELIKDLGQVFDQMLFDIASRVKRGEEQNEQKVTQYDRELANIITSTIPRLKELVNSVTADNVFDYKFQVVTRGRLSVRGWYDVIQGRMSAHRRDRKDLPKMYFLKIAKIVDVLKGHWIDETIGQEGHSGSSSFRDPGGRDILNPSETNDDAPHPPASLAETATRNAGQGTADSVSTIPKRKRRGSPSPTEEERRIRGSPGISTIDTSIIAPTPTRRISFSGGFTSTQTTGAPLPLFPEPSLPSAYSYCGDPTCTGCSTKNLRQ